MNDIYIYGSGGLGRGVLELIENINTQKELWNIKGFLDDNESVWGAEINDQVVLGNYEYLAERGGSAVVIAIADPGVKMKLVSTLKETCDVSFPNIIHPSVSLSRHNIVGEGNILSQGATLSVNIRLGNFNLLHLNCSIGHDARIENYVAVYPNASVAGYAILNNSVEIGSNASVIQKVNVGEGAIIGAGSVVIKDIPKSCTAVGVPAKPVKFHQTKGLTR